MYIEFLLLKKKQQIFISSLLIFLSFPLMYSLKIIPSLDIFYCNFTKSAPVGLYIVAGDQRLCIGDYVVMNVPDEMKPYLYDRGWTIDKRLLKQVAGLPAEKYEVWDNHLFIHGYDARIQDVDHENLPLPKLSDGGYTIPGDKFMPVSVNKDNSFDARYTGPLDKTLIIKKVVPFMTLPEWLEKYV